MAVRDSRESYNKYMRENHLARYYKLKAWVLDLMGGKCVKCGSVDKLEIDHVDRKTKSFSVSLLLTFPRAQVLEEIKKCQLLCQPCHQIKSILEQGKKPARGTHGTVSAYRYCRCQLCGNAKKRYSIEYYKTRKRVTINGKRIVMPL